MDPAESTQDKPVGDMAAPSGEKTVTEDSTAKPSSPQPQPQLQPQRSGKAAMALVLLSVFLSMFPVGLDRTIVSTAIPVISNEFNSLDDVGWYGSAYLLTCCAFQLLFGKVYSLFPIKPVLLANILLFGVASAICGAAPNSTAFILGRAIAGVAAAGIFAGTIVCVVHVVPLHQRPKIQGMFGALFGLASILGPIIGGAFTSRVTWRWCFYINLPLGGVAMVIITWLLKVPPPAAAEEPLRQRLAKLDLLGTAVLMPGVVCLLLALQWGGTTYTWSNGRIIALLTLAGVLLLVYGFVQAFSKTATLPPSLVKQRTVLSSLWAVLTLNASNYVFLYFLPIWFQAIQGVSPVDSGIRLLPMMISSILGSVSSGWINARIGYYTPLAMSGSCIMAIGAGLLTTLQIDTSTGKWIGYQILYGYGLGSCFQIPNLAVQAALPKPQVPVGLAFMLFGSLMGSTVFVSVGQNVYANQLIQRLSGFPGFDPQLVTSGGVTAIIQSIAPDSRAAALVAYNDALREVFRVGLIVACLAVLGTFTLEWLSVKKKPTGAPPAATTETSAEAKTVSAAEEKTQEDTVV